LLRQQAEAADAKKRSEQLLYEILPRDIVHRLNQGEHDICFVVPSATLAFIDIEKFSAYMSNLQPQATMRNLSTIFQGYDAAIAKYPLCQKMKLVGDVYMMAAGLFAPEERHADQGVRFCLDCLNAIDDANHLLDSALAVRIGINTGGPLTAGVLGFDKPTFDILGDPINVAARLQTTAPAGRVQISESTYDLVKESPDLAIEPRGEVLLKGKGPRPAFLVSFRAEMASSSSSTREPGILTRLTSSKRVVHRLTAPHSSSNIGPPPDLEMLLSSHPA
jgi:class 3 adenylate cyclase